MNMNPRDYAKPSDMFSVDELPFGTGELILEALDLLMLKLEREETVCIARRDDARAAWLRQRQQHVQCAKDTIAELMDDSAERQGFVPSAAEIAEMEIERERDARAEDQAFGH